MVYLVSKACLVETTQEWKPFEHSESCLVHAKGISRKGVGNWPPKSPDLTSLDNISGVTWKRGFMKPSYKNSRINDEIEPHLYQNVKYCLVCIKWHNGYFTDKKIEITVMWFIKDY